MIKADHSHVLAAIASHASTNPDQVALVEGGERVTYSQLAVNIEHAAVYLQTLGLKPGDHVVLSAQKEPGFVYLYLAAHLIGVVNVVVDSALPADRLDYILSVTHPVAVFSDRLKLDGVTIYPISNIDFGHAPADSLLLPRLHDSDVADVMFTTGTTGHPKGVCLTHANIAGSASNTNGYIGTTAGDIEALALPLSHSFGLGRLRCVLMAGATLVLVGNFANLKSFFTILETERVTGFGMVPAVWQYIKRLSGTRIAKFADQIRYIEIGSAAMSIEDKRLLMELFPNTRICMHYGLTEASRAMFTEFHADSSHLDAIGRPASVLVEACVLDDDGRPVKAGEDGEICVRGNMVISSYFLDEDNKDSFHADWFRTGDWGHQDPDGLFYLTGRKKELINVGGEKVSPVTIEEAILSLGIADCACIGISDPNGVLGEVPKAFLVRGSDGSYMPSIEEIKHALASKLPSHEIPVEWEWVESIPRTSSGKIQRLKLKK